MKLANGGRGGGKQGTKLSIKIIIPNNLNQYCISQKRKSQIRKGCIQIKIKVIFFFFTNLYNASTKEANQRRNKTRGNGQKDKELTYKKQNCRMGEIAQWVKWEHILDAQEPCKKPCMTVRNCNPISSGRKQANTGRLTSQTV